MIVSQKIDITNEGFYRLRMWVSEYSGDETPFIFVYQRPPTVPEADNKDRFVDVAALADLKEYPEHAPESAENPFYREYYLDLEFDNLNSFNRGIERLRESIDDLVKNIAGVKNSFYEVKYVEVV